MDTEPIGRFFFCARVQCRTRVLICPACDRGQIYCCEACSNLARRRSLSEAGRRYQDGRAGRHKHADRMRRYRALREKVTHHGSPLPPIDALLTMGPAPSADTAPPVCRMSSTAWHCHFCACPCSAFVRSGFLGGRPNSLRVRQGVHARRRGDDDGHSP